MLTLLTLTLLMAASPDHGREVVNKPTPKLQLPTPELQRPTPKRSSLEPICTHALDVDCREFGVDALRDSRSDAQTVTPQAPVMPRTPARDKATPAAKGTAVIKGRVVSADGERPLRRAQIRISGAELPEARVTSTNARGLFEVRDLPAGRYTILVQRSGYLPLEYGQRRPGEPGRPLQVSDKEVIEDVNFMLPRTGVISGQIADETGDVVAGVTVYAMQSQYFLGRRRLVPIGSSRTDETGQYRVLALPPGDYVLMAILRETWTTRGDNPQVLGYAPSYFPGTANAPDAQRVKVGLGQEVSAVDFSLVPGRAATVAGTAMRADGSPLTGGSVGLSQEIVGPHASSFSSAGGTKAAADGSFSIPNVAPGEYRLSASGSNPDRAADEVSMTIVVQGVDLDLRVVTGTPATLHGQVVTDTGQPLPGSSSPPRIFAESLAAERRPRGVTSDDPNGLVGAGGAFTLKGLTGPVMLKVWSLPRGWTIDRVELGGRDYAQAPLEIPAGQEIAGAKIVVTNSFPTLTGRVVDDAGEQAEGTVILFPSDPSQWVEAAGRVLSARPDQAGTFRFDSVRPGDYLVTALEYVPAWQVGDPEFLAQLRERAAKLTIGRGELAPITVTLRK